MSTFYQANPNRYGNMTYQPCGESGLKLPAVSLGLWHNFGNRHAYENMRALLFTAFDNGVTHFDIANNYGPPAGMAESNFGKIYASDLRAHRNEMIISTKAGYYMWEGPYGNGGSRKYLAASLDDSLRRTGLDYFDIFYHHRPDSETPLYETMWALNDIVKSGKALYVGLSNYNGEQMAQASQMLFDLKCPFVINQNRYSMLDRTIERNGLLQSAIEHKKGVITFCPLEQGLLTDRYLRDIPADSRVALDGKFLSERNLTPEKMQKIRQLNEVAKQRGQSLAQMALAWIYSHKGITSVLIGASKPEQILDNLGMLSNTTFTQEELQQIDKIVNE